jgi:hypothetical protein
MTVAELIVKLQQLPQELTVVAGWPDGYDTEVGPVDVVEPQSPDDAGWIWGRGVVAQCVVVRPRVSE